MCLCFFEKDVNIVDIVIAALTVLVQNHVQVSNGGQTLCRHELESVILLIYFNLGLFK